MENYQDIQITCVCGEPFTWTKGEQKFLQGLVDDGKTNSDGTPITVVQPKRCKACRLKKKQERQARENRGY